MTRIAKHFLWGGLLPLIVSALPAQIANQGRIVGWNPSTTTASGEVHVQDMDNNCQAATPLLKVLGTTSNFWCGGTAYDPARGSLWVSDGAELVEIRLSDGVVLCKMKAMIMNRSGVVSGLAIDRKGRKLIQLETAQSYAGLRSYSIKTCPPTALRDGCTTTLPTGYYSGGLAYDDVEDLVYFSVTKPGFQVPYNEVWVADGSNRCNILCKVAVGGCVHFFGTDSTGLAYDAAKKTIYMTFGGGTVPIQVVDPRKCQFKTGSCCTKQSNGTYAGLAWVPGWSSFKKGTSCLTKGCPFCSNLGLDLAGSPVIGNTEFGLTIHDGPTGAASIIAIGPMTCGKGTHFLCGALWLPGGSFPLFSGVLTGAQCQASTTLPLPVPVDTNLCGATLCVQALIACGTSGFGITEAIQFSIGK